MKNWKRISYVFAIVGFTLATTMSMLLTDAAEQPGASENQQSQRVFKFKTSDPNGMNFAMQTRFQTSKRAAIKMTIQSGNKTETAEFIVKSESGDDVLGMWHTIDGVISEKNGWGKPEVRRHPKVGTRDGFPAEVQIGEFYFEVLIESVKN